jgi:hypothetical protein
MMIIVRIVRLVERRRRGAGSEEEQKETENK